MEYIYGKVKNRLVLKTMGEAHTDFSGLTTTVTENAQQVITDTCDVIEKYKSTEDVSGKCYDWYYIENHTREISNAPQTEATLQEHSDSIDDIICTMLGGGLNV